MDKFETKGMVVFFDPIDTAGKAQLSLFENGEQLLHNQKPEIFGI